MFEMAPIPDLGRNPTLLIFEFERGAISFGGISIAPECTTSMLQLCLHDVFFALCFEPSCPGCGSIRQRHGSLQL
jgi:hypothetical protein